VKNNTAGQDLKRKQKKFCVG